MWRVSYGVTLESFHFFSYFRFHYIDGQWTMAVNVPPEYSRLDQYRATLGHKANHGGEEEVRPKF